MGSVICWRLEIKQINLMLNWRVYTILNSKFYSIITEIQHQDSNDYGRGFITPYSVCGDGFAVLWGVFSTMGGYHDSCGEATLSTMRVFRTVGMSLSSVGYLWVLWGDTMIRVGRQLWVLWGCSVLWGCLWVLWGIFEYCGGRDTMIWVGRHLWVPWFDMQQNIM